MTYYDKASRRVLHCSLHRLDPTIRRTVFSCLHLTSLNFCIAIQCFIIIIAIVVVVVSLPKEEPICGLFATSALSSI